MQTFQPALNKAYQYCIHFTRQHVENFPVASFFIRRALRPPICAIYAYLRIADDYADDPNRTTEEKLLALDAWCLQAQPQHPVFVALADTIERFSLPIALIEKPMQAFRADANFQPFATFADVLHYTAASANPVGRLLLLLHGYHRDDFFIWSDYICTALQLMNFWQDLSVDLAHGRLYVPLADMADFDCDLKNLQQNPSSPISQALIAFQIERTKTLLQQGFPLVRSLKKGMGRELRLIYVSAWRLLEKMAVLNSDLLVHRPTLNWRDKLHFLIAWFTLSLFKNGQLMIRGLT